MKTFRSFLLRIVALAGIAWYFWPSISPPKPSPAIRPGNDDSIQWKFRDDPNPAVTQSLTVYGDGRSSVVIVRPMLDPDLPEGGGWNPRRDPENNCVVFSKNDLLTAEAAKGLFERAISGGALDLLSEPVSGNDCLEIRTSVGGTQQVVKGPTSFEAAFAWNRIRWVNRQRWQKVIASVKSEAKIYDYLKRKDIVLVND